MAFLHCAQSWARSSHNEGAILAFLRLLFRTLLNLSHCPPCLQAWQDSWPYMMSLGSLPWCIPTTCPAQHSWAGNTMVETADIPAQERTSVLGTLSHQVTFIREHRWCCCSWSIWHKCLWYRHHTLHPVWGQHLAWTGWIKGALCPVLQWWWFLVCSAAYRSVPAIISSALTSLWGWKCHPCSGVVMCFVLMDHTWPWLLHRSFLSHYIWWKLVTLWPCSPITDLSLL